MNQKPTPELTRETLLKYLDTYGLTQQALANLLDLNVVTVNRWCNHGIPKHYNKLIILALAHLAGKMKKINRALRVGTPDKTAAILAHKED